MKYKRMAVLFFATMVTLSASAAAFTPVSSDSSDSTAATVEEVTLVSSGPLQVHELSFWGGYSFDSFRLWGKTANASIQSFGLRYNRKFLKLYNSVLEYIFKISFYSKVTYPEFKEGRPINTLSGYSIVPLGFQLNFRADKVVQPFINSTGGVVLLNAPFPDRRGKKLNFTFSIGSGIEFIIGDDVSLALGLKYHHLSNGYLGQVNPGIDSPLFYTALTIF